ncbi:MAG: arsenosugar biosynthesis-associated peroxidase-like protein [Capsulimonadales bacterium]|nr:arsenosugar biosynthesis-associated peroxidase-like protein [Capsulimonadales bacterium]
MAEYYHDTDLQRLPEMGKESPDLMHRFLEYYDECLKENSLSKREKALIGLGVSHVVQCPYCIDSFTKLCREAGLSRPEMTEAVHVGAAVSAGATISHGLQMIQILDREEDDSGDRESSAPEPSGGAPE